MIGSANVTFRTVDAMDVVEISYPDGKVAAFPVDEISPEDGRKYSEIYGAKYAAFKNGDPDSDRVAQLEREIAERQAELDASRKAPDKKVDQPVALGKQAEKPVVKKKARA